MNQFKPEAIHFHAPHLDRVIEDFFCYLPHGIAVGQEPIESRIVLCIRPAC